MRTIKNWLVALGMFIGSAIGIHHVTPPEIEEPTQIESPSGTTIQNNEGYPIVKLQALRGATPEQKIITDHAISGLNQVLKTPCFKEQVLDATFTENKNLNNDQIYSLFSSKIVVVDVKFFYGNWKQNYIWKTMGIDIGDGTVYVNSYFVKDAETLGSLIAHEALGHGLGFTHKGDKYTSVPYNLNRIVERCGPLAQW